MSPKASIIITTYNRAEHLRQTLRSLGQARVPREFPAELLVVDNASTDDTASVVKSCKLPSLPVRYLYEPKKGQSNARNSGMANTSGEIILFTDDDVRVPQDWIGNMCRPIAGGEVDAIAGGIKIPPHLLRGWMKSVHQGWLAFSNENYRPKESTMTGANMAFSRRVLAKVPAFDPELGPGALGYSDDTLFSLQLNQAGFVTARRYDIAVDHWFDESRLKYCCWIEAARKRGRTKAYLLHHWYHTLGRISVRLLLLASWQLFKWRATHRNGDANAEGCAEEELRLERNVSFRKQCLVEQRRACAYPQRGLVKSTN
jgi:glucosyl-dolichyl phosphate glucuronosyltransferase